MNCFCASARQVARLLTRFYTEELGPAGITPAQFELLGLISHRPGLSQVEIAEKLSLDQTTLSRNLKPMIARRWIKRGTSHEDSRSAVYALSDKGAGIFRDAYPLWRRAQARIERFLGSEGEIVHLTLERLKKAALKGDSADL